ncbi:MAG: DUF58 domain-containing protein [Treponema sp.]|nr:DUF58 domain-containing protein [Treponema sp.]
MKTAWAQVQFHRERLLFGLFPFALFVYIFTPWKPVQFLMFFFIFLVLSCRLYSEYLIRHLALRRGDKELRGFRHEWIEVELAVENRGRLPAFMMAATDTPGRISVFRNNKILCTLWGGRSRMIHWQGFGTSRGLFVLGPGTIRGADPLGLFPFTLVAAETTRLFVYPAPGYVNLKSPGGIPLGVLASGNPFNEDLTRRRSLREYNGGDELRRINWKASARMSGGDYGALMVNEYEASLSYPLVVFLNADPLEYASKNREIYIERAIEAAAALCVMASRERQAVGFILHSSWKERDNTVAPSAFTLIPILERLAILERRSIEGEELKGMRGSVERLLKEGKTLPFGTRLVYVGPSLGSEDYRIIESVKGSHITLEYLLLDETTLGPAKRHYQIKERGYEIL